MRCELTVCHYFALGLTRGRDSSVCLCRAADVEEDVQGLGKGMKRRSFKKRTSSKTISIQADSQLPVTSLQVCLLRPCSVYKWNAPSNKVGMAFILIATFTLHLVFYC